MDDRWRDTYDAWKLRSPYDERDYGEPDCCERCGQNMRRDYSKSFIGDWFCPDCYDREAEDAAQDAAAIDDATLELVP